MNIWEKSFTDRKYLSNRNMIMKPCNNIFLHREPLKYERNVNKLTLKKKI